MHYRDSSENSIQCQWSDCKNSSTSHVFNSKSTDSAYLCSFHKKVAQINLDKHDRIRAPVIGGSGVRPTMGLAQPPKPQKPKVRPGDNWEQEAAQKADQAAQEDTKVEEKPVKQVPRISPIIRPKNK